MKAKRLLSILVCSAILLSMAGIIALSEPVGSDPLAGVRTVVQDFSDLGDLSSGSDPIVRAGSYSELQRIVGEDGSKSLSVSLNAGGGTAAASNIQIGFSNAVPAGTEALAIRLTMPEGPGEGTGAQTSFFNSVYVNLPNGAYNPYMQHAWKGYYLNASLHGGDGYKNAPVDIRLIDAATGSSTTRTLNEIAYYEGYNFLDLNGFDGWVVVPLDYWMEKSNYGDPLGGWATGMGDVLYETLDPTTINGITVNIAGNAAGYTPVYHEIAAVSDIEAFVNAFKSEIEISAQPANVTVYEGSPATFAVTASSDKTLSYQWEKSTDGSSWAPISGATSATYTIAETTLADNGSKFRCVITAAGAVSVTETSAEATLSVRALGVKIVLQDFVDVGTTVSPDGGFYPWGNVASVEKLDNGDGTYSYKAIFNAGGGWRQPSFLNVGMKNKPPASTQALAFRVTLPDTDEDITSGFFGHLYVDAPNGSFSPYLQHTWKGYEGMGGYVGEGQQVDCYTIDMRTGAIVKHTLNEIGTEGNNFFIPDGLDGWIIVPLGYWMDVTNYGDGLPNEPWVGPAAGVKYESIDPAKINGVHMNFNGNPANYTAIYHEISAITDIEAFLDTFESDIEISSQPQDAIVSSGQTATFSVTAASASNQTISYQWQKSTDGSTWVDIAGATSASYTTPATVAGDHLTKYRCILRTETAITPLATDVATLWVDRYPDVTVNYEIGSDPVAASVFEGMKGKNGNVVIRVSENGELLYTWTFSGTDITDAVAFNPEIEMLGLEDIGLEETAADAVYFKTAQTGKFPGKAKLALDTSFNFFENEDLWLYQVGTSGKLTLLADGLISGVSTSTIELAGAGSYLLNNAALEAEGPEEETPSTPGGGDVPDTGYGQLAGLMLLMLGAAAAVMVLSRKRKAE